MDVPIQKLEPSDSRYPQNLSNTLRNQIPFDLRLMGNPDWLNAPWLGLFCSSKCPGSLILRAYDFSIALQKARMPLSSGFHSPVERDALKIALRGEQPILVCPARGLEGMRIPVECRKPLVDGRLLFASIFPSNIKRPTTETAYTRNRFVAALAENVLVIHAEPDSKLISLIKESQSWGKVVYTLADPANDHLIGLGCKTLNIQRIEDLMM